MCIGSECGCIGKALNGVKYLEKDLSEYYSDFCEFPVEILSSKRQRNWTTKPYDDKVVVRVPEHHVTSGVIIRSYSEQFHEFMEKVKDAYEHIYEDERKDLLVEKTTRSDIVDKVDYWCGKMGIPEPKRITMSKDNSKWGSCRPVKESHETTMTFYSFLFYLPVEVAEATIIHECVHAMRWFDLFDREMQFYDGDEKMAYKVAGSNWNNIPNKGHDNIFWSDLFSYISKSEYNDLKDQAEELHLKFFGKPPPRDS